MTCRLAMLRLLKEQVVSLGEVKDRGRKEILQQHSPQILMHDNVQCLEYIEFYKNIEKEEALQTPPMPPKLNIKDKLVFENGRDCHGVRGWTAPKRSRSRSPRNNAVPSKKQFCAAFNSKPLQRKQCKRKHKHCPNSPSMQKSKVPTSTKVLTEVLAEAKTPERPTMGDLLADPKLIPDYKTLNYFIRAADKGDWSPGARSPLATARTRTSHMEMDAIWQAATLYKMSLAKLAAFGFYEDTLLHGMGNEVKDVGQILTALDMDDEDIRNLLERWPMRKNQVEGQIRRNQIPSYLSEPPEMADAQRELHAEDAFLGQAEEYLRDAAIDESSLEANTSLSREEKEELKLVKRKWTAHAKREPKLTTDVILDTENYVFYIILTSPSMVRPVLEDPSVTLFPQAMVDTRVFNWEDREKPFVKASAQLVYKLYGTTIVRLPHCGTSTGLLERSAQPLIQLSRRGVSGDSS